MTTKWLWHGDEITAGHRGAAVTLCPAHRLTGGEVDLRVACQSRCFHRPSDPKTLRPSPSQAKITPGTCSVQLPSTAGGWCGGTAAPPSLIAAHPFLTCPRSGAHYANGKTFTKDLVKLWPRENRACQRSSSQQNSHSYLLSNSITSIFGTNIGLDWTAKDRQFIVWDHQEQPLKKSIKKNFNFISWLKSVETQLTQSPIIADWMASLKSSSLYAVT